MHVGAHLAEHVHDAATNTYAVDLGAAAVALSQGQHLAGGLRGRAGGDGAHDPGHGATAVQHDRLIGAKTSNVDA